MVSSETISQRNGLGKEDCELRIKKIGKIIDSGIKISIRGIRHLKDSRIKENWAHHFENHGTFNGNGRSLQFWAILICSNFEVMLVY